MRIELKGVRLQSWGGQIWNAKSYKGNEPTYSAHFIFGKDHKDRISSELTSAIIERAMLEAATEKFGAKAATVLKSVKGIGKVPMHDGDDKEDKDGYPGNWYVSARTPGKNPAPKVLHRARQPDGSEWVLTQRDGIIFDGCFVDAIIDIYAYDTPTNGVTAGLKGIRYVGPGDAFGGGAPVTSDSFSELSADDIEL